MANEQSPRDEIRNQTMSAMLTDAFFQWPSAVTIGLTIIAFFSNLALFPGWQPWYWLVVGAALEVVYLVATLTDPKAREQAARRILTETYDPKDIRNLNARTQLQRALDYKKRIDEFVAKQASAMKVALQNTADEIEEWIGLIYRLAQSIDRFEANKQLGSDIQKLPTEIASLKRRLSIEQDPGVKAELHKALEIKESLQEDLKRMASLIKRTEIKMDTTVAQLNAVYTKMQLINAKELDSGRAKRLEDEIHDEVASLEDIVGAMDDVYSSSEFGSITSNISAGAPAGRRLTTTESGAEDETTGYTDEDSAARARRLGN